MNRLSFKRTKIVATIGPASASGEVMERLVRAGVNVARLNLSHGSLGEHAGHIETLRGIGQRLGTPVSILVDLPGPKYRIGELKGGQVTLKKGASVRLTTSSVVGDASLLPVDLPGLAKDVRVGDSILLDDGAIRLRVSGTDDGEIECRVVVGGLLLARRGLVIPGRGPSVPFLTDSLCENIAFAVSQKADYLALSFVSSAGDIAGVRAMLRQRGASIPIVAKIERAEAVRDFGSILSASDAIMVARGDLGVEIPLERVPLVQKDIIQRCNRTGKPVITATQMLESMVSSPRPTRAETTDVANAIFDGTDATMLSAETSIGKYPVEAVRMMARIARETEKRLDYEKMLDDRGDWVTPQTDEVIAYSACRAAHSLGAAAIVALTNTGGTAARLARYRPRAPILALTPNPDVALRLPLRWGVYAARITSIPSLGELFHVAAERAREMHLARSGDLIVITGGVPLGVTGGTNLLKVERVS